VTCVDPTHEFVGGRDGKQASIAVDSDDGEVSGVKYAYATTACLTSRRWRTDDGWKQAWAVDGTCSLAAL
jgi:hypothetical protein